jgi:RNA-directed DNA polymerase
MPLSPFFANLLLRDFDKEMQLANIQMVRYADDLICFASSKDECMTIHGLVQQALASIELTVPGPGPGSKTQIYSPDEDADFLGLRFRAEGGNYLLEVSAEQTSKICQRIIEFADVDALTRSGINLGSFFRRLDGIIAGYAGAYEFADNAAHLDKVLSAAQTNAIERVFRDGLGIEVKSLTPEKKQFLGIEA